MLLETLRVCREALEHPTYGVNAKLATIQLDTGDARPPLIQRVLDPSRDDGPANGSMGTDTPLLLLAHSAPVDVDGEITTTIRDTLGGVGVRIGCGLVMDQARLRTAEGWRDMLYTLRAVMRSYAVMMSNAESAARTRNGIQVRSCLRATLVPDLVKLPTLDVTISGAVFLDLEVRDTEP